MIDVVEADAGLPPAVRRQFSLVRPLIPDDPELAIARLIEMATAVAGSLIREVPNQDLAKCTGIEGFYSFYVDDDCPRLLCRA